MGRAASVAGLRHRRSARWTAHAPRDPHVRRRHADARARTRRRRAGGAASARLPDREVGEVTMRQVAHLPLLAALVTSCVAGDGASSDAPLPEWTLRETLRIGARDESDQNLTRVLGVLPVPNGYVWVMQSDDNQFRVYSPEGRLVQTVGEEGQGPGQLIL